ncbi:putative plastid-lipid-associated protein, chloroplastic-like [Sesbania bispinosa]|nr:putative plastid-lipid-associated protein, chloroplastic-like [Sesbania bispinosa]
MFMMHDSGKDSIPRLEWNSSPEPFNFGSLGSLDPPSSSVTMLNFTPYILPPTTVGIRSKPIGRPRILADVPRLEVSVPAVMDNNEWEESSTDVAVTESEVLIRGGSREQALTVVEIEFLDEGDTTLLPLQLEQIQNCFLQRHRNEGRNTLAERGPRQIHQVERVRNIHQHFLSLDFLETMNVDDLIALIQCEMKLAFAWSEGGC